MLGCHGAIAALLFYSVGYLVLHASGARTFLLRIREHAEALELGLAHKIQQRFEARLGFARETHNKRSAQRDTGHAGANARDQFADVDVGRFATHAFQHHWMNVLQGHIDVARDLFAFCDRPDQFIGPMRRMRVEDADPEIAGNAV